jgi:Nucleotidyltransferase domain
MQRPSTLPDLHRRFIDQAVPRLAADPRIVGIALSGSYADDTMDEFSDLDFVIAVEPDQQAPLMAERQAIAGTLGPLLVGFPGDHVGEPRLLICLYGPPVLHVDLKFVALPDAAHRVDQPVVVWERDDRLTNALRGTEARYPTPTLQWMEDRFWVWVHYAATKIGRGEYFEALEFFSFVRVGVLGPLGLAQLGLRPAGVRKVEALAPALAAELRATVARLDAASLLAALRSCIATYRRLRGRDTTAIEERGAAEEAAVEYLAEIERRCGVRSA